ncbi:MAG: SDR family oxidoreductase [Cytophagales bacterium]|nr:SDR family oxidoreductase [Cytophagales bacterium]
MKVLIFGASGSTGQHLVKQALAGGHEVTAFVRDPAKITLGHARLTLHQGNVGDFAAVQRAVSGQQAVLSALGADNMFAFDKVLVEGMGHILRAMQSAPGARLVYLSTLGVRESRHAAGLLIRTLAPTLLRTEILGHEAREERIRASALDWVIVRAPILTNGPPTRHYQGGENLVSTTFATTLSRADVATFMLSQLTHSGFVRKSVRLMPTP